VSEGGRAADCVHPRGELVPVLRLGVPTGWADCAACGQRVPTGGGAAVQVSGL